MTKLPPRDRDIYEAKIGILWSFLTRLPKKCIRCGYRGDTVDGFDANHIIRRNAGSVRYVLDNGCCLCVPCHREFWHSTTPAGMKKAGEWIEEKFGKRLDRLEAMKGRLSYHTDWWGIYDGLWSEVVSRGAEAEFRAYLDRHPVTKAIWDGKK